MLKSRFDEIEKITEYTKLYNLLGYTDTLSISKLPKYKFNFNDFLKYYNKEKSEENKHLLEILPLLTTTKPCLQINPLLICRMPPFKENKFRYWIGRIFIGELTDINIITSWMMYKQIYSKFRIEKTLEILEEL
jgi:hypothetical protein